MVTLKPEAAAVCSKPFMNIDSQQRNAAELLEPSSQGHEGGVVALNGPIGGSIGSKSRYHPLSSSHMNGIPPSISQLSGHSSARSGAAAVCLFVCFSVCLCISLLAFSIIPLVILPKDLDGGELSSEASELL